ncbi:MAG: M28 family peptidase, partial [Flavobacteriales bacterium]|nr:M28 family peptidase [Flavobacteriales bacterium]
MRHIILSTLALFSLTEVQGQNQPPQLSNVQINVPWSGNEATITYDVTDAENDDLEVSLLISDDGGLTHRIHVGSTTGDVGFPITPGINKEIIWDFDTISNVYAYSVRIVANDGNLPDIQSIVDQVDSVLIRNDLSEIQGIRHYQADPTHLEETKDNIEDRFNQFGLSTRRQAFERDGYTGHNIIGRKAGLGEEESTFIIDAHFDSVDDAPGADDNGSGVVGVLEALRVLAPYNFDRTITFIGFDFEESVGLSGTYGSLKYVQSEIPNWENIDGVINFEMIGYYDNSPNSQMIPTGFDLLFPDELAILEADSFRGNFIVNAGDAESFAFTDAFDTLAEMYVPELKVTSLTIPLNGLIAPDFRRSDHANFWDIDAPALLITDGADMRNPYYHTPADTLGLLNFTFMSNVVKAAVATVATLAGIQNSDYADAEILPSSISESNHGCSISVLPNPSDGRFQVSLGKC